MNAADDESLDAYWSADANAAKTLLPPGTMLMHKYRIEKLLGEGAFGAVYKATNVPLEQAVAVKILHHGVGTNAHEKFQREAKLLAVLRHPNLAQFHAYEELPGGDAAIIMEYLEGRSLSSILKDLGSLSAERAGKLFLDVCRGMKFAHENGILHRDLKPSNIIVIDDQGVETAKVIDFGIGCQIMPDGGQQQTATGVVQGTPAFMSPEQCAAGSVDARSDVYSFGCVMYATVCGHPPFEGESLLAIMASHANRDIVSLPVKSQVPEKLYNLILKCLRRNRDDRVQSMNELLQALQAIDWDTVRTIRPTVKQSTSIAAIWRVLSAVLFVALGIGAWRSFRGASDLSVPKNELIIREKLRSHDDIASLFPNSSDQRRYEYYRTWLSRYGGKWMERDMEALNFQVEELIALKGATKAVIPELRSLISRMEQIHQSRELSEANYRQLTFYLADCYVKAFNSSEDAMRVLEEALKPPHQLERTAKAEYLRTLAGLYNGCGRWNEAEKAVQAHAALSEGIDQEMNVILAQSRYHLGLKDQALDLLRRIESEIPSHNLWSNRLDLYHSCGDAYLSFGKLDMAINCYKKAVAAVEPPVDDPHCPRATLESVSVIWREIANCCQCVGDLQSAEHWYRKALPYTRGGPHWRCYADLLKVLHLRGTKVDAVSYMKSQLSQDGVGLSEVLDATTTVADTLSKAGEDTAAKAVFELGVLESLRRKERLVEIDELCEFIWLVHSHAGNNALPLASAVRRASGLSQRQRIQADLVYCLVLADSNRCDSLKLLSKCRNEIESQRNGDDIWNGLYIQALIVESQINHFSDLDRSVAAIDLGEKIIKEMKQVPPAIRVRFWSRAAAELIALGRYDRADGYLERLQAEVPKQKGAQISWLFYWIGTECESRKHYQKAIELYLLAQKCGKMEVDISLIPLVQTQLRHCRAAQRHSSTAK